MSAEGKGGPSVTPKWSDAWAAGGTQRGGVVAAGLAAEVNLGQVFTGLAGHVILRVRPMRVQSQRDVGRLHRLLNYAEHIVAQGVEVGLLAQPGVEGR